jgi:hypothetical protein
MKQILPVLTPSNVNELFQCSKKYAARILRERPYSPMNAAAQRGIAVHRVLRDTYDPSNTNGQPPDESKINLYARIAVADRSDLDPEQRREEETRCVELVRYY